MLVAQNSLGPVCPVPLTVRGTRELAAQQNDPSIKITTTLGLTKADLGRIVNGKEGDPLDKRPFEYAFSKSKVLGAWEKVGAVPLTRQGLKHPKVRHEAVEGDLGASEIQELEKRHRTGAAPDDDRDA